MHEKVLCRHRMYLNMDHPFIAYQESSGLKCCLHNIISPAGHRQTADGSMIWDDSILRSFLKLAQGTVLPCLSCHLYLASTILLCPSSCFHLALFMLLYFFISIHADHCRMIELNTIVCKSVSFLHCLLVVDLVVISLLAV